jgi:hypothetical protein
MAEPEDEFPIDHPTTIFISHKLEDHEAALVLARYLKRCSAELEIFVAGSSEHRTNDFGRAVSDDIADWLSRSEVVVLLFTAQGRDWSWCMWEAGVATDPRRPSHTRNVVMSLSGQTPAVFRGTKIVMARELESLKEFIHRLCLDRSFFPRHGKPLAPHQDKDFTDEIAKSLWKELSLFRPEQVTKRWKGFTVRLNASAIDALVKGYEPEAETDRKVVERFLENAMVIQCDETAAKHFLLTNAEGKSLLDLRRLWLNERRKRNTPIANNKTWDRVIADEVWRICQDALPQLSWDPFLGLDGDKWLYPVVMTSSTKPDHSREFEFVLLETRAPGAAFPGE